MSQQNVELARRAYEVFDTDIDGLLELLGAEVEWVSPSDAIEPGIRHGHDGVREAFAATAMAWQRPTHTPEELLDGGDTVMAQVTFRGLGHGSGMEAEETEFHVWTLRSGSVVRFEWFYQREPALRAAGLGG